MMRTEARWKEARNTRGLPLGMARHVRGVEKMEAVNRQAKLRASRPSKFARLVAGLNGCRPVRGLRVRYGRTPVVWNKATKAFEKFAGAQGDAAEMRQALGQLAAVMNSAN